MPASHGMRPHRSPTQVAHQSGKHAVACPLKACMVARCLRLSHSRCVEHGMRARGGMRRVGAPSGRPRRCARRRAPATTHDRWPSSPSSSSRAPLRSLKPPLLLERSSPLDCQTLAHTCAHHQASIHCVPCVGTQRHGPGSHLGPASEGFFGAYISERDSACLLQRGTLGVGGSSQGNPKQQAINWTCMGPLTAHLLKGSRAAHEHGSARRALVSCRSASAI